MNFQNQIDFLPEMLNDLPIPDRLDPDILRSEIVFECGLLIPLYSEPQIMRTAIRQWFRSREWTFDKLIDIIEAKYSPIENTDRYEEMTRDENLKRTENEKGNRDTTRDRDLDRDGTINDNVTVDNTTEDKVSAYNTDSYSESSQRTGADTTDSTRDETENIDEHETVKETHGRDASENADTTEKLIRHVHGNIGVTSNVQLINEQLGLLEEFNIYKWIAMNLRHSLFLEVW